MLEAPVTAKNKLLSLSFLAFIYQASGACSYNENILAFSQCMYLASENNLLISCFMNYHFHFPPQEITHQERALRVYNFFFVF